MALTNDDLLVVQSSGDSDLYKISVEQFKANALSEYAKLNDINQSITAAEFIGSGAKLTDVVNSLTAGPGLSVDTSTGDVTISQTYNPLEYGGTVDVTSDVIPAQVRSIQQLYVNTGTGEVSAAWAAVINNADTNTEAFAGDFVIKDLGSTADDPWSLVSAGVPPSSDGVWVDDSNGNIFPAELDNKVGIGTDAPERYLHVYTSNTNTARFESTGSSAVIELKDSSTTISSKVGGTGNTVFLNANSVRQLTAGPTKDGTGNGVGIATSEPKARFDVNGKAYIRSDVYIGGDGDTELAVNTVIDIYERGQIVVNGQAANQGIIAGVAKQDAAGLNKTANRPLLYTGTNATNTPLIQANTSTGNAFIASLGAGFWRADSNAGGSFNLCKSRSGIVGQHNNTVLEDGDLAGNVMFLGGHIDRFKIVGHIRVKVDNRDNIDLTEESLNSYPGAMEFRTGKTDGTGAATSLSLRGNGPHVFVGEVQSASTLADSPDKTLVTKDYVDGALAGVGSDIWQEESDEISPINPNAKVKINTQNAHYNLNVKNELGIASTTVDGTGGDAKILFGKLGSPQAGIEFQNNAQNGRGNLVIYNKNANNTDGYSDADEVVRITRAGYVGINATAPTTKLQIGDLIADRAVPTNYINFGYRSELTTESNPPFIGQCGYDDGKADLGLGARSGSGNIRFFTGNASAFTPDKERMVIASNGNVGIGVEQVEPTQRLHIANTEGTVQFQMSSGGTGSGVNSAYLKKLDTNDFEIRSSGGSTKAALIFGIDTDGEAGRFDSNGRFGIGIDSPTKALHVRVDDPVTTAILEQTVGDQSALRFTNAVGQAYIGSENDDLYIGTSNSNNRRVTCKHTNGRVGIATTEPKSKLDVAGNTFLRDDVYIGGNDNTTLVVDSAIELRGDTSAQGRILVRGQGASHGITAGVPRMTADGVTQNANRPLLHTGTTNSSTPLIQANTSTGNATISGLGAGFWRSDNSGAPFINICKSRSGIVGHHDNAVLETNDATGTIAFLGGHLDRFRVSGQIRTFVRNPNNLDFTDAGLSSYPTDMEFRCGRDTGNGIGTMMTLYSNGNVTMTQGDVGIGVSNPAGRLHVASNPAASGRTDTDVYITLNTTHGGKISGFLNQGVESGLEFSTVTGGDIDKRMTILGSNGNVGIGTTDPLTRLEVKGDTTDTIQPVQALMCTRNQGGNGLYIGTLETSFRSYIQAAFMGANNTNYPLLLNPKGGSIGINTTEPGAHFHVKAENPGNKQNDKIRVAQFQAKNSNVDFIKFDSCRVEDGTDWKHIKWKIQRQVDNTPMGFISFGHNTDNSISPLIAFGKDTTEFAHISVDGKFFASTYDLESLQEIT